MLNVINPPSVLAEKLPCMATLPEKPTTAAREQDDRNYIIANVQRYGFYRVNYDAANWERIIDALPNIRDQVSVIRLLQSPNKIYSTDSVPP